VTRRRPRIVDWTALWAGPWTADQLRRAGSVVNRIEHPRRRDGLLGWPEGRRMWRALNGHKPLALLDARHAYDRQRLEAVIGGSDVLITSMTPRACRSLGFDDGWREAHAPDLLHIELVAFEEPWADSPGLGEHAAAQAGLLWRDGALPARPAPWADPLLGAAALAFAEAWLASPRRPAGRVRFSLEAAARLVFAIPGTQSGME
jgi:crotonobetainyl-CoA:carnitine CoA-transferase CaiB-like acyl-CoA transferase